MPATPAPNLTAQGRQWAEANYDESIVARAALTGYGSDWPVHYIDTAIRLCNSKGAEHLAAALERQAERYEQQARISRDEGDTEHAADLEAAAQLCRPELWPAR